MNLQVGGKANKELADAWHHQMIFGAGPAGIYMTNPLECASPSVLMSQLSSPSVLLVKRTDVVSRGNHEDLDLSILAQQRDPRWRKLNVLGKFPKFIL